MLLVKVLVAEEPEEIIILAAAVGQEDPDGMEITEPMAEVVELMEF
jgi:hypothetical protein